MDFSTIFSAFFGLAMLAGCVFMVIRLQRLRWDWFADPFGKEPVPSSPMSRSIGPIVISKTSDRGLFAKDYTTYLAARMTLHADGISISIEGADFYGNRPFFLPFADIRVAVTKWPDLLTEAVALRHRQLSDAYIVMARSHVDWAIANGAAIRIGD